MKSHEVNMLYCVRCLLSKVKYLLIEHHTQGPKTGVDKEKYWNTRKA